MKTRVYIDGQSGTTGLQIYDRIGKRDDLTLMRIPEDKRHDADARKEYLNNADIVFLCLPDDGAREAVSFISNADVKVIDASTAHRTSDDWTYGFPELSKEQRAKIAASKRVANPGCHATGFIAIAAPLVKMGLLPDDYDFSCFSLTGYSGGGKKMIADYEGEDKGELRNSPGIYGLGLKHKHLPEMVKVCGLKKAPIFVPVVDDYYKGMATTVPVIGVAGGMDEVYERLAEYYKDEHFVEVIPYQDLGNTIYANTLAGTNKLKLVVSGNSEQVIVTSLFDNLGKGASGAAVQNMNIMLGVDEATGL